MSAGRSSRESIRAASRFQWPDGALLEAKAFSEPCEEITRREGFRLYRDEAGFYAVCAATVDGVYKVFDGPAAIGELDEFLADREDIVAGRNLVVGLERAGEEAVCTRQLSHFDTACLLIRLSRGRKAYHRFIGRDPDAVVKGVLEGVEGACCFPQAGYASAHILLG